MRHVNARTLPTRVTACAVALLAAVGTGVVSAQKGKGGAAYTVQVLGVPAGFADASAVSINDSHEIVGTARITLSNTRAVYWAHAGAAPVLLPCLSEPCLSSASAINGAGVISGTANGEAVLWHPDVSGWITEVLLNPDPQDETSVAVANHVLDDGTAAGWYAPTTATWSPTGIPVIWGQGSAAELPIPEGFLAGRLGAINDSGDAVGDVRVNDGASPTYVYGALWINDGGTYVATALTFSVSAITPRAHDGSFLVASDAGRLRVSNADGSWNYVVDANPGGPGIGINAAGDMVGVLAKGGWLTDGGTPYLLTAGGTLTKLPLPSRVTGTAAAVSNDRWVAGVLYAKTGRQPAVWVPAR
jgi:hypothetical protein